MNVTKVSQDAVIYVKKISNTEMPFLFEETEWKYIILFPKGKDD